MFPYVRKCVTEGCQEIQRGIQKKPLYPKTYLKLRNSQPQRTEGANRIDAFRRLEVRMMEAGETENGAQAPM